VNQVSQFARGATKVFVRQDFSLTHT
jgi:hypothetical protein